MRHTIGWALFLIASAGVASAQPSSTTRLIPFSGTASDVNGLPLSGAVKAIFELYEEQEHGEPLWQETQDIQTDDRGRYLVYLGTATPIPQIVFTEERARWLAINVGGRDLPRVMLVAVPYALRAADAETLGGQPASAYVRSRADGRLETASGVIGAEAVDGTGTPGQIAKFITGTSIGSSTITESASNRVGFGLIDPTGGGVVDSVFTIRNFDNNTGFGILNQNQQRRFAINTLFSGGWAIYDGGSGIWNQGLSQVNGNVGIGTTAPESKFTIRHPDSALTTTQLNDSAMGFSVRDPANQRRFAVATGAGGFAFYDGADNVWRSGLMQLRGNVGIDALGGARLHIHNRQEAPGQILPTSPNGFMVENLRVGGTAITSLGYFGSAGDFGTVAGFATSPVLRVHTNTLSTLLTLEKRGTDEEAPGDFLIASTFVDDETRPTVVRIDAAGTIFANGGFQTGGADFAEEIDPADTAHAYEPGDVLVISSDRNRAVARAQQPYATAVLGVYSTKPGITASPYGLDDPRRKGKVPVAMIGIVPCRVSTENGPIERGDLLVTSTTPGHAMKGTDRGRMMGAIVGKALEPLDTGTGTILIAVTLQ